MHSQLGFRARLFVSPVVTYRNGTPLCFRDGRDCPTGEERIALDKLILGMN